MTDNTIPESTRTPFYGIGPFTLREVILGGIAVLMLLFSFFSLVGSAGNLSGFGISVSLYVPIWATGLSGVVQALLGLVAVGLLLARRLMPSLKLRVGSLSVDQFASVAFSVVAAQWFFLLAGGLVSSWVVWIEFILALGGVALTVFARFIPTIKDDFDARPETAAHVYARPARAVEQRPAPAPSAALEEAAVPAPTTAPAAPVFPTPSVSEQTSAPAETATPVVVPSEAAPVEASAPIEETPVEEAPVTEDTPAPASEAPAPAEAAPAAASAPFQPFWALAPVERDVFDAAGAPVFRVGPTAWALVVAEHEGVFTIRHDDGRIGYLYDTTGVRRG